MQKGLTIFSPTWAKLHSACPPPRARTRLRKKTNSKWRRPRRRRRAREGGIRASWRRCHCRGAAAPPTPATSPWHQQKGGNFRTCSYLPFWSPTTFPYAIPNGPAWLGQHCAVFEFGDCYRLAMISCAKLLDNS